LLPEHRNNFAFPGQRLKDEGNRRSVAGNHALSGGHSLEIPMELLALEPNQRQGPEAKVARGVRAALSFGMSSSGPLEKAPLFFNQAEGAAIVMVLHHAPKLGLDFVEAGERRWFFGGVAGEAAF
jgi:hypothetical protein